MTFLYVQQHPSGPVGVDTSGEAAAMILAVLVVAAIVASVWMLMGESSRGRARDGRRLADEAERWLRNRAPD